MLRGLLGAIAVLLVIAILVGVAFEIAYTVQYMNKGIGLFKAAGYAWDDITGFIKRIFTVNAKIKVDIEYPMANAHIVWDSARK